MADAATGSAGEGFDATELFYPKVERSLRYLPRLLIGAFGLVWGAARSQLVLNVALQGVSSVALALQVLVGKQLLTKLLADNTSKDFSSAVPAIVLLAAVMAVASVVAVVRNELQRLLSEMVSRSATQQVVDAACRADLAKFEDPTFHDRLQRAIVNATIRPLQMTSGLLAVGSSALGTLAIGAVLLTIEPLFFLLGVVAAVPLTLASLRVGRALYRFAVEQTPTDRERMYIQSLLVEKDPAKEIRAYELGGFLRSRFAALYQRRIHALRRLVRRRTVQGAAGGLLTAVVSGGVLGLLIVFVSDGRVSLAGAGAAAAALILLGTQLQGLAAGMGQLYESALFIQDFNNFVQFAAGKSQFVGTAAPPSHLSDLSVRDLTFTYPSRQKPSLLAVNLEIRAGQVVALVGENGSGKTTLAKLLAGLYLPQEGRITWNDQDVTGLDITSVRGRVAVLFQDFVRYFLSARENIAMGRWERSGDEAAVREAATRSGAHPFVEDLPRGYDTYLGPQFFGGSDLSGGQWQRVALARAFFRDAELVILDEPTAALDPRAEAALFSVVRQLFSGRSVVLISHRFATVRMADHIYVLAEGRIVEHGDHDQLMASNGLYAELFTLQASTFGLHEPPSPAPA
ncbi:MAG TPA: ABC transporter ATP-binding protein [Acidimicrobiales bacterium]|nr:ABC transporter ATP-binding protein [Acidimicrobiales bacterium]